MLTRLLILGEVGLYREVLASALGRDERFQVVAVVASVENALLAGFPRTQRCAAKAAIANVQHPYPRTGKQRFTSTKDILGNSVLPSLGIPQNASS